MKRWIIRLLLAIAMPTIPVTLLAQSTPPWATVPEVPPLPKPDASGFVSHAGARLYYAAFHRGGRSPVILLHGGLASSDSWGFEVPQLVGRHEVIVMDSRGHGRSSKSSAPLSYALMASDVIALMDALHIRRASIVGASDGGITGLLIAIRHPERVAGLFAWGANFNTHSDNTAPPDPAMKEMGARFMARMEAQYRLLSPTPEGFAALRAALGQLYASEPNLSPADLGRIKAPTIIADGAHEQFIARDHTEQLAHLIPGAKLIILPNVSHGGPQQDPVAFHRAVTELLKASSPVR
jgi:pimeloyl-ACP methyl ester carboxylesterase